ncbi:MAG: asparagine--tRNA ligase [archaeon]|nr:asparagine--tRNA ligase [archaeon]
MSDLKLEDNNSPNAPTKPLRNSSFSGRIRVTALLKEDAEKWIDKIITVGGWAKSLREGGNKEFCFIDLNDGSTIKNLQVVVMKEVENFADICKEGIGSCFLIRGLVVKSPGGKQAIEIRVENKPELYCKVVGTCLQKDYPLMTGKEAKKMKLETLRDICHLRPRTNIISCVTRIRNNLAYATHIYFQNRGFQYIHTPLITSSDCEGAGSMFQVTTLLPPPNEKLNLKTTPEGKLDYKEDFFGKPTYLTVSGQLAVENYACALSDVYTFGPTFRAEVSHTSRHLAEFWMIEPEMCFADLFDDMECGENYLKFCLKYVLENNKDDLEFLEKQVEKGLIQRLKNVIENDFKRLPYTEAIEILKEAVAKNKKLFVEELTKEQKEAIAKAKKAAKEAKKKAKADKKKKGEEGKEEEKKEEETKEEEKKEEPKPEEPKVEEKKEDLRNIYWGMDMASQHERYLTEEVFKMPVIVYNYPKEIKSFYMKLNPDGKTVAAADILVPRIGEIIGGSQREENYEVLMNRMKELKMDEKSYWWYMDLRRFGSVPHSGFGLGFERLVMMATGVENIRDVIPYPRYPGHADF